MRVGLKYDNAISFGLEGESEESRGGDKKVKKG